MTLRSLVLALHIAAGSAGLILGPIAMRARKRPGLHTGAGEAYHWVVLTVCLTAGLLALLDWKRLWWFLPIAAGSYAFALLGYLAAKRRWTGWLRAHVAGQGGSYIAITTALLVVNWQTLTGTSGIRSPWAWGLPTVVGSPIIAWVIYQVRLGKRPKRQPFRKSLGRETVRCCSDAIFAGPPCTLLFSHSKKKLAFPKILQYQYCKMTFNPKPKGALAARLRQRKFERARRFRLPEAVLDLLPGSLSQTARRCGKPTCHCRTGEGHPSWYLTFMAGGKKHVERIPADWAEEVRRRVEAGRAFKDAVAEVLAANAQLLVLWRRQTGR